MKARTGKIARLPKAVREQLNRRLADGEQGEVLLEWLHSLPEVLEVLARDFDARPILKQNLSDWRKGGFRDWEARQERLEQVRLITEEADDMQNAAPELADRMAALLAGRFAGVFASTLKVKDWSKPRQLAQLMEMCEGVASLRRFDQGRKRLDLEREQLEMKKAELELAREAQTKRTHAQWREWTRDCLKHLHKTCKTPEELIEATDRLIFGQEDDSANGKADHGHKRDEESQKLAANIITQRDQLEADRADIKLQENRLRMRTAETADAIQEVLDELLLNAHADTAGAGSPAINQSPPPQESQGQSNPVKP